MNLRIDDHDYQILDDLLAQELRRLDDTAERGARVGVMPSAALSDRRARLTGMQARMYQSARREQAKKGFLT